MQVEEVSARLVKSIDGIASIWENGEIPVIVDPECQVLSTIDRTHFAIEVLVDARMTKKPADLQLGSAPLMIGLGPGFVVGQNCNAIVETKRGHYLGRVLLTGSASQDTGVPEGFGNRYQDRVLRSPADGVFRSDREIGDQLIPGDLIGEVDGEEIHATFKGVLRGLLHPGLYVSKGFKIGDLDPRNDPGYCKFVSDKALAVAGGVLEAILRKEPFLEKS
jgi:xanthine dehydrogenase accessory factor